MTSLTRRQILWAGAGLAGAAALPAAPLHSRTRPSAPKGSRITVPNGSILPWTLRDGVKVFHLVAEPVVRQVTPHLRVEAWGYNGQTPGPVIELEEGDRCRFYVTNRLPEATSLHWHGILLPSGMDGVSGLSQPPIEPGETFVYEFRVEQHGTFMYHAHFDEMTQINMGLQGMIVVHPAGGRDRVERDFVLMLNEWSVDVGTRRPDPNAMDGFNVLTFNGASFPSTEPLVAERGDRVRIRIGNMSSMDHHPVHLHGYSFVVAGTDGGPIPPSARWPETTVLVPTGSARWIEFTADAPGDWAIHCHMTHHVMTQMSHGIPNVNGIDVRGLDPKVRRVLPGYMTMGHTGMGEMSDMGMAVPANSAPMFGGEGPYSTIDMGGMFTILKVRDRPVDGKDPGWYRPPPGTLARSASKEELARDGIED